MRRLPTHVHHPLGERDLTGISEDATVCSSVAGIADQLCIPNADTLFFGLGLRENGHCGPDASTIGCIFKMSDTRLEDFFGAVDRACVKKMQTFPKQAADTARIVAPGQFGHVFQLAG